MNQVASSDTMIATLTHIGGIFFGFLPSLIVWLIHKDTNPYITEQSREALNFQLTMLIALFASVILMIVGIGFILFGLLQVVNLVVCIIAAIKVANGEPFRYPFSLRLIN